MFHPKVAFRDCKHCLKYIYDEKTGLAREDSRGENLKRLPTVPAPCRTKNGCPKGTAENQKELSKKNMMAYQHWKECKAVSQFPDDPIVRRNAAIIQEIVDHAKEYKQVEMLSMMMLGRGV